VTVRRAPPNRETKKLCGHRTEAEKNQVKAREFRGLQCKEAAQLGFVVQGRGVGIGIFGLHAKNVFAGMAIFVSSDSFTIR